MKDEQQQQQLDHHHHDDVVYSVAIVGAGIAGMATAIGLVERGVTNIVVLEKATELKPVGASIAIFNNGLRALQYLSPTTAQKVQASCIPIDKMVLKDQQGNTVREKKPPTSVNYMVWYLLQQYLAEGLPPDNNILKLGHALESFTVDDDGIVTIQALKRRDTTSTHESSVTLTTTIRAKVLVGTDGIHSPIRRALFAGSNGTSTSSNEDKFYHGKISWRAVLPLSSIQDPPVKGVNVTYQGDAPGTLFSFRETATDILTVTSMACCSDPSQINYEMTPQQKKDEMLRIFKEFPEQVQQVIQQIEPTAIHMDPIHDVATVLKQWSKGPVIVIGDAAHAMSPSFGQGANQSLESACVLVHYLVKELHKQQDGNTTTTTTAAESSIAACLQQVTQHRFERVQKIHAASRARSIHNNSTSQKKPVDMHSQELRDILQEIDNWNAPVE